MPFIYSVSEAAWPSDLCRSLSTPIIAVNCRRIRASVIKTQPCLVKTWLLHCCSLAGEIFSPERLPGSWCLHWIYCVPYISIIRREMYTVSFIGPSFTLYCSAALEMLKKCLFSSWIAKFMQAYPLHFLIRLYRRAGFLEKCSGLRWILISRLMLIFRKYLLENKVFGFVIYCKLLGGGSDQPVMIYNRIFPPSSFRKLWYMPSFPQAIQALINPLKNLFSWDFHWRVFWIIKIKLNLAFTTAWVTQIKDASCGWNVMSLKRCRVNFILPKFDWTQLKL